MSLAKYSSLLLFQTAFIYVNILDGVSLSWAATFVCTWLVCAEEAAVLAYNLVRSIWQTFCSSDYFNRRDVELRALQIAFYARWILRSVFLSFSVWTLAMLTATLDSVKKDGPPPPLFVFVPCLVPILFLEVGLLLFCMTLLCRYGVLDGEEGRYSDLEGYIFPPDPSRRIFRTVVRVLAATALALFLTVTVFLKLTNSVMSWWIALSPLWISTVVLLLRMVLIGRDAWECGHNNVPVVALLLSSLLSEFLLALYLDQNRAISSTTVFVSIVATEGILIIVCIQRYSDYRPAPLDNSLGSLLLPLQVTPPVIPRQQSSPQLTTHSDDEEDDDHEESDPNAALLARMILQERGRSGSGSATHGSRQEEGLERLPGAESGREMDVLQRVAFRNLLTQQGPLPPRTQQALELMLHAFERALVTRRQAVGISGGAPPGLIESLPTFVVGPEGTSSKDQLQCPVCLEDYAPGETLQTLPCFHMFHQPCIDSWIRTSSTKCPVCKIDVMTVLQGADSGNSSSSESSSGPIVPGPTIARPP
mmetsp:Transcript_26826/g.43811  ORF Transcript_26826/g.43811 Transcript_26826/m.43811 type:complete len:534 (+) Transcript_26826:60-1661(+)